MSVIRINENELLDHKINQSKNKIIVPLPPRYIVEKVQLFKMYEASWSQIAVIFVLVFSITAVMGIGESWISWVADIGIIVTIVAIYSKYAWTHEKMIESKIMLKHKIRKFRGLNRYSSVASPTRHLSKLYPYAPKRVLSDGVIEFENNRYGIIIDCQTKQLTDEELQSNIIKVGLFLNSLQILIKIRAGSKIPYLNPVEKTVIKDINTTESPTKKALLYSLHDLSSTASKAPVWNIKLFLAMKSTPKEIEAYVNTILPGIVHQLGAANTVATIIKRYDAIYNIYANDFTSHEVANNKTPALFGENTIWKDRIRQLMQGSIIDNKDHILVNHREHVTCIMVGVPVGGVSGFPPHLSPEILNQLYRLSASEDHTIRIDFSIYPIPSPEALRSIKDAINKLLSNEKTAEGQPVARFALGLDIDDLKILYAEVKDGKQCIFDLNFIITIYAKSYESLIAGRSKVTAILNANNIQNRIPENRILETLKATQFLPYYDNTTAVWLPTNGLSQIVPIVNGPTNISSTDGTYYGNEIGTNQEVIIDLDRIAGGHTLMIGPTRSGKTTAMSLTGIRTILKNEYAVYITNKPDATTNYLAVAEYFHEISQIINLGRLSDGSTQYNVNPLEILYNKDVPFDPVTKFYEHIDFVKFFISLITSGGQINERRTDKQLSYIETNLLKLYARYGIDPEDITTWKPEKQPTLIELQDMQEHDLQVDPKNTTIEAVVSRMTKVKTTLSWLSNPTNVDLNKPYTVIDLSAVPETYQEAMNYLLTNILALRFNVKAKTKTTIMIDEAGVFLKNQHLQDKFSLYLKQAASFGVRVIIGSQQLADLTSIGPELRANISISEVYGLNIGKSIDDVMKFFKLTDSDKQFLLSCSKPGQCVLSVGYPYASSYHIQRVPSELEAQVLFKKQERQVAYSFIYPALEQFAKEQGIILGNWIKGDTTMLRSEKVTEWIQKVTGTGRIFAYIDPEKMNGDKIINQSKEHFLSVMQIASWFIERGIPVQVSHTEMPDILANLPEGPLAIEYQMPGHNDIKRIMNMRKSNESKYGRLLFVGNPQAAKELIEIIGNDEIVVQRGKALEQKLYDMVGESRA